MYTALANSELVKPARSAALDLGDLLPAYRCESGLDRSIGQRAKLKKDRVGVTRPSRCDKHVLYST